MISSVLVPLIFALAISRPPKIIELGEIVIETEVEKPNTIIMLQMPAPLKPTRKASGLAHFQATFRARTGLGSVADHLSTAWELEKSAVDENLSRMPLCESSGVENCTEIDLHEALAHAEMARSKLRPGDIEEAQVHALLWRLLEEDGPTKDRPRAMAALEALLRLDLSADIGAWVHFTLGSAARNEGRFDEAHRHILSGRALDATLPGGPRWFFDYLLAYTEWALRKPGSARRMEAAIAGARVESPETLPGLELELLRFWGLEPSKVATHLTYLETHCGPRAQFLAQELLSIYSDIGEVDSSRQVMHWLSERSSQ